MKKYLLSLFLFLGTLTSNAQGWPDNYGGVMLQGFYWDSFNDTKWTKLASQAPELSHYFKMIWVPQSGNCGNGKSMGYNPLYYFNQQSSFGSEDDLRAMIKAFKDNGIGTMADVVVNHRGTLTNWVDFPAETYKGVTYQMKSTDICRGDDGGKTKEWADANGYQLSQNNDEGEDWSGMRDLDHQSLNVINNVKAYVKYLVEDLGYTGFRYDMVKGFAATHVGDYNNHAGVQYSVGEHWGNVQEAKNWIDGTKYYGTRMSAAFDFQFHYRLSDAITKKNWSLLRTDQNRLIQSGSEYNRYAVTFVENHDTQYRSSSEQGSCPISTDIVACNAHMLAMPGTPCVFLKHWLQYKNEIKKMIEARKMVGITNTSTFYFMNTTDTRYVASMTKGSKGNLIAVVGSDPSAYNASAYKKLCEGQGYIYYVNSNFDTTGWDAILERIKAEDVAQPEEPYTDHDATIYVSTNVPWSSSAATSVNYWVWSDTNSTTLSSNKSWPGDKITQTATIDGETWFKKTFRVTKQNHPINIVVSTGTGSPQTVDFTNIENDVFLKIENTKVGSNYAIKNVTSEHTTGIKDITLEEAESDIRIYSVNGQYMGNDVAKLNRGIYLRNGKKYAVSK